MKKIIIPIVLFAAVACSTEVLEGPEILSERHITISASISDPETRTERASYGTVLWCPGDEISLFYGSGADGGSRFTSQNTEKAKVADFSGTINVITGGNGISEDDTYFWAVYPYDNTASCDGESITTNLPSKQVAVAGTFANGLFPTLGRSKGVSMPFYNICGGLKFSVTEEGIKSVTLHGNNNEIIAGRITVGFDDGGVPVVRDIREGSETIAVAAPEGEYLEVGKAYYIVMVPTEFERGFTLTFEKDSSKAIKTRQEKTTIRRSVFGVIANVDNNLEWGEAISVEIPDENFRAYMLQCFDINGDGILDSREAEKVTRIVVITDNIASLKGIEYCPNLEYLSCRGTGSLYNGQGNGILSALDVSQNSALTYLHCGYNQLTSLDVSKNTALTLLYCHINSLTSLDVMNNKSLKHLACLYNQLESLDVSHNTALTGLECDSNQLKSLILGQNYVLTSVDCKFNQLVSLDISQNTALTSLDCCSNQLSSLDVSHNTALRSLLCYNNQLTSLDVTQNTALTGLNCYNNQLTSLDVTQNTALTGLNCYNNQLTSLDVSQNTALTVLNCYNNQLTSLDVSQNTALTVLNCYNNQLTSLDVSHNTALTALRCNNNQMPSLDVSQNTALTQLSCHSNQLTSLDVSQNTLLTDLRCYNNQLPSLDVSHNTALTALRCNNNQLPSLDVSYNTALQTLYCHSNQLTNLDLSQNTLLTDLRCDSNQLTILDVSRNTALTNLYCDSNQLTSLDVSKNTSLSTLDASPMNDAFGNNLLSYLYIRKSQPIQNVTYNRSLEYIPDETIIMVTPETLYNEGIEAVDLGLSVKWATCNIGAFSPEEFGYYFAWGGTNPKSDYSWSTYTFRVSGGDWDDVHHTVNVTLSKYITESKYGTVDNKTVLDPEDDAAHVNWGGSWRMPTDSEWTELRTKCTWTWTSQNGVNGRKVTGPNGNSIFLPAAGNRYGTSLGSARSRGDYWSSSLITDFPGNAWLVYFDSDGVGRDSGSRYCGQPVRPVTE